MSEETPNFNIDPDGGMTTPAQFAYRITEWRSCCLTLGVSLETIGKFYSLRSRQSQLERPSGR
jgi:hypothetical protein